MELKSSSQIQIVLPDKCQSEIIDHCRRKLAGQYLKGEAQDLKAFGLIAGTRSENTITVKRCMPLLKNARSIDPYKGHMDRVMTKHAIPSETPLHKRGWVADPEELTEKVSECHAAKITLLGTYHMHRVGWQHDKIRDTPTKLDTILGHDSRMIMFIVSMVEPDKPIIRAFFEGICEQEIVIIP
ncbi:MAG: hypothetical protein KKB30_08925 [Proteobacteria bacterium]|nr:hypothetical protein [Pseudomonadota bacterium]MBU1714044.1 hypothetical protein [Pseudomonadota bacterium]